jgi:hypothetical protein
MMEVPFTFGIITNADTGPCQNMIDSVCSIRELEIPNKQIIIVGNAKQIRSCSYLDKSHPDITVIDFNESIRTGWISRKKNLITQYAQHERIIYQHDYFRHNKDWYEGFKKFGDDWNVVVPRILNWDGSRYREWVLWIHPQVQRALRAVGAGERDCLLPYNAVGFSKYQYISGAYWVAKKCVMHEFPLNESLLHEQGEDTEWSNRVNQKYEFSMNPHSSVQLTKTDRHRVFEEMDPTKFEAFKKELLG